MDEEQSVASVTDTDDLTQNNTTNNNDGNSGSSESAGDGEAQLSGSVSADEEVNDEQDTLVLEDGEEEEPDLVAVNVNYQNFLTMYADYVAVSNNIKQDEWETRVIVDQTNELTGIQSLLSWAWKLGWKIGIAALAVVGAVKLGPILIGSGAGKEVVKKATKLKVERAKKNRLEQPESEDAQNGDVGAVKNDA